MTTHSNIQRFNDEQDSRNAPPPPKPEYDMMQDQARSRQAQKAFTTYANLYKDASKAQRIVLDEEMKDLHNIMTPFERAQVSMVAGATAVNPRVQKRRWWNEDHPLPNRPTDQEDIYGLAEYGFAMADRKMAEAIFMGDQPGEKVNIVSIGGGQFGYRNQHGSVQVINEEQVDLVEKLKEQGKTVAELIANNGKFQEGKAKIITVNGVTKQLINKRDFITKELSTETHVMDDSSKKKEPLSVKLPASTIKMMVDLANPESETYQMLEETYASEGKKGLSAFGKTLSSAHPGWKIVPVNLPKGAFWSGEDHEFRSSKFHFVAIPTDTTAYAFGQKMNYDSQRDMYYDGNGRKLGSLEETEAKLYRHYLKKHGKRVKDFTMEQALEDQQRIRAGR